MIQEYDSAYKTPYKVIAVIGGVTVLHGAMSESEALDWTRDYVYYNNAGDWDYIKIINEYGQTSWTWKRN